MQRQTTIVPASRKRGAAMWSLVLAPRIYWPEQDILDGK
jgi:hypothetical protein